MVTLMQTEERSLVSTDRDQYYAFSDMYNAYFPRVYNYVYYRVSDSHDADDLTSQIFTKLYTKLQYYQPEKAPFSAWVFTIARNTVTDYYRHRFRNSYVSLEEMTQLAVGGTSLDEVVTAAEMSQQLQCALTNLSQREREIIALKFWSGFSNRQIANLTGNSESNIGVILFRSMRRLRQILEGQGMNRDDG